MSTQSTPPSFSLTKLPIVCLLAGICCALWGSAFPCVKIGYMLFSVDTAHVPSILLFAGMRFFLAGVLAVPIGSAAARRPLLPRSRRTWRHIAHLSLLQTILQYIFFYIGLAHTTGVKGSIIGASNAFAALLIAALLFRQRQRRQQRQTTRSRSVKQEIRFSVPAAALTRARIPHSAISAVLH